MTMGGDMRHAAMYTLSYKELVNCRSTFYVVPWWLNKMKICNTKHLIFTKKQTDKIHKVKL